MNIYTKGNVIVNEIKIKDIHYEYDYGCFIKSEVVSLPIRVGDGYEWTSKCLMSGNEFKYVVSGEYPHYGPNLYDYEAYQGCKQISVSGENIK